MKKLFTFLLVALFFLATAFAQNGKYIGTVKINPLQPGQTVNFHIMSGNYSTAFRIDAKNGDLFVNNQTAIDAYSSWRYILVIRLRYSTPPTNPMGTAKPIITDTMRTIRILNIVDGKFIGKFLAKDPDVKQNQKLSYYFMSGNYNTAYKIHNATGNISVANASYIQTRAQTKDKYTLNVRVRDNGKPNLDTYANAIIKLWGDLPKQDVFNCRYP